MPTEYEIFEVDGHEIRLSNPGKVYFPQSGWTKADLARYHVQCADAILNHVRERPTMLKRFPGGIDAKVFYQKRVPEKRPDWLQTAVLKFPSGREAEELVPVDAAHLLWAVSLGNVDWNPHPVRRSDLDHPDELRVDIDPMPDAPWDPSAAWRPSPATCCASTGWSASRARRARAGCTSWSASTSAGTSSRCARRRWRSRARSSAAPRGWRPRRGGGRSARRTPSSSTTTRTPRTTPWRRGYSIRPVPDARVACHLRWDEVADCELGDFRIDTVPERLRTLGDPSASIDATAAALDSLLDLARRDAEERGLQDA